MLNLSGRQVMAIINVTPDSFFEGSRTATYEAIRERVKDAISEGATMIDIGGYSSRPGAAEVSPAEEWRRVSYGFEVVREVARELSADVTISLDTFRAEVVRLAAERFGCFVVNDITAGEGDEQMLATVAKYDLPYIAMHMRGTPQSMQSQTNYDEVATEVAEYLRGRVELMKQAGIKEIILDPGFGFAKSVEQNYELMAGLGKIAELGYPLLVGISRKSMIYKPLDTTPAQALAGTIALNWEALRQGATILRVHDTREAVEILRLYELYTKQK